MDSWAKLIESLVGNPFVILGSYALTLTSILLAFIFYFRSKKDKIPYFTTSNNTLIEGLHKSLDGLQILYKNTNQERITVTKVLFWNAGRQTINKSDLLEGDPI